MLGEGEQFSLESQKKLEQLIINEAQKSQGVSQRDIELAEMRKEVEKVYA